MALDAASFQFNPGQQRVWDGLYQSASRFCLVYGGSRSGKTFLTVYTLIVRALKAARSKHLIVRQEASSARASLVRGNTATIRVVLNMCFPGLEFDYNEQYGYGSFPNGSEIWVGGLNDDKAMERVLGNEYASIYINEASEVKYSAFPLLRTRLAQVVEDVNGDAMRQRFFIDLNPTNRLHWTYRVFVDGIDPDTESQIDRTAFGFDQINPTDNALNLSTDYLADLSANNERYRKRFFDGEYAGDDDNALWRRDQIKRVQLREDGSLPVKMRRIVVAIDPAISKTATSDETGIVAVGLGVDGRGYVLEDASGKYKPEEWARAAIAVYETWSADRIIGEVNQGGDMVEAVLRAHAPNVPYKAVRATRGKVRRAEPTASLYELKKVFHVGEFQKLEDQMMTLTTDFDDKAQGWSPDRVDALVWACTELFPQLTARKSGGKVSGPQISMV